MIDLNSMKFKIARSFAAYGSVGFVPTAPGTVASVVALIPFVIGFILGPWVDGQPLVIGWTGLVCGMLLLYGLAWWAIGIVQKETGLKDPAWIVIDEVLAAWILYFWCWVRFSWWVHFGIVLALFRLFDIYKPGVIGVVDRQVGGSLGVLLDDVLAVGHVMAVYEIGYAILRVTGLVL